MSEPTPRNCGDVVRIARLLERIEEQAVEIASLKSQNAALLRHIEDLKARATS